MNFLIIISVIYPDIYTTNYELIKRAFLRLFYCLFLLRGILYAKNEDFKFIGTEYI